MRRMVLSDPFNETRGVYYLPRDLRPKGKGPGASWKGRVKGAVRVG